MAEKIRSAILFRGFHGEEWNCCPHCYNRVGARGKIFEREGIQRVQEESEDVFRCPKRKKLFRV